MLSVVFIWSYMLLTMFLTGYAVLRYLSEKLGYRIRHAGSYLVCGLILVTVYAQVFSLFAKVGLAANVILCCVCALILYRNRTEIPAVCREWIGQGRAENKVTERGRREAGLFLFFFIFLFFLFAYGTSRGMIHYDTGLYHAQSIRWIEEYGIVRGLGNLHCRLAYNSASFALSALYSMAFLGGQSFHCAAGFVAWMLAGVCLEIGSSLRRRRLRISDFARAMGIYYLVNIFDEMVSPASDYFMVLLAFYLVIRWLELLERGEKNMCPYALLCIAGVFLVTVKLSAAVLLLLTCYPAYHLLKERKWRQIGSYLVLGLLTAVPYFVRNVIISGWLVYPFTAIDLFKVSWKIPWEVASYDEREIQVWGRGYQSVAEYDNGIGEWFPRWFGNLSGSEKGFVALSVLAVAVLLVWLLGMLLGRLRRDWGLFWLQATVALSFLFWLFTSPLIRYGCVYVYLTPAVVFGGMLCRLAEAGGSRRRQRCLYGICTAAVSLLLLYKAAALAGEIAGSFENRYWILQKDYENYEVCAYEIEGVTFYYPAEGDRVGYDSFPSSPAVAEIRFLGEDLAEGFQSTLYQ